MELRIATRPSALARAQADWVRRRLESRGLAARLVPLATSGDRQGRWDGPGQFTREIDQALLEGRADLAVHSLKDLPTALADGVCLAAVPEREDPRDAVVAREGRGLEALAPGARVGTTSPRRRAWLERRGAGRWRVVPLRGNIDTRLEKVARGEVEAAILAAAGLKRLGRAAAIGEYLDERDLPPAPGQGALGVTALAGGEAAGLVAALNDESAARETTAERALLRALGAGCRVPVGARGRAGKEETRLHVIIFAPDGTGSESGELALPAGREEELGRELGRRLLAGPAAAWLTIGDSRPEEDDNG